MLSSLKKKTQLPYNWWLIYWGVQCGRRKVPLTHHIDPQLTLWVLLAECFLWGWFFKGPINIQWQCELWGQSGEWWAQHCHHAGKANEKIVPAPAPELHVWLQIFSWKKEVVLNDGWWQEYEFSSSEAKQQNHKYCNLQPARFSLSCKKDEIELQWPACFPDVAHGVGGCGGGWRKRITHGVEGVKVPQRGGWMVMWKHA